MKHTNAGRVHSVNESSDGKHVTVSITHGKRKRTKGPDGKPGELQSHWDRPSSSITLPKSAASAYAVGQRVHAGIAPADESESEDDLAEEETAEAPLPVAKKKATAPAKGKGPMAKAFAKKMARA